MPSFRQFKYSKKQDYLQDVLSSVKVREIQSRCQELDGQLELEVSPVLASQYICSIPKDELNKDTRTSYLYTKKKPNENA